MIWESLRTNRKTPQGVSAHLVGKNEENKKKNSKPRSLKAPFTSSKMSADVIFDVQEMVSIQDVAVNLLTCFPCLNYQSSKPNEYFLFGNR